MVFLSIHCCYSFIWWCIHLLLFSIILWCSTVVWCWWMCAWAIDVSLHLPLLFILGDLMFTTFSHSVIPVYLLSAFSAFVLVDFCSCSLCISLTTFYILPPFILYVPFCSDVCSELGWYSCCTVVLLFRCCVDYSVVIWRWWCHRSFSFYGPLLLYIRDVTPLFCCCFLCICWPWLLFSVLPECRANCDIIVHCCWWSDAIAFLLHLHSAVYLYVVLLLFYYWCLILMYIWYGDTFICYSTVSLLLIPHFSFLMMGTFVVVAILCCSFDLCFIHCLLLHFSLWREYFITFVIHLRWHVVARYDTCYCCSEWMIVVLVISIYLMCHSVLVVFLFIPFITCAFIVTIYALHNCCWYCCYSYIIYNFLIWWHCYILSIYRVMMIRCDVVVDAF
jgi:hypothetical protein